MTPSERERRIEAGIYAWLPLGSPLPGRRLVAGILDAAHEAVPMVSEAEMQRRSRIDHEAADREHARAERADAAARDFARELRLIMRMAEGSWRHSQFHDIARRGLAKHPSFSGEEGTEG